LDQPSHYCLIQAVSPLTTSSCVDILSRAKGPVFARYNNNSKELVDLQFAGGFGNGSNYGQVASIQLVRLVELDMANAIAIHSGRDTRFIICMPVAAVHSLSKHWHSRLCSG
jgi:hypothetical protein